MQKFKVICADKKPIEGDEGGKTFIPIALASDAPGKAIPIKRVREILCGSDFGFGLDPDTADTLIAGHDLICDHRITEAALPEGKTILVKTTHHRTMGCPTVLEYFKLVTKTIRIGAGHETALAFLAKQEFTDSRGRRLMPFVLYDPFLLTAIWPSGPARGNERLELEPFNAHEPLVLWLGKNADRGLFIRALDRVWELPPITSESACFADEQCTIFTLAALSVLANMPIAPVVQEGMIVACDLARNRRLVRMLSIKEYVHALLPPGDEAGVHRDGIARAIDQLLVYLEQHAGATTTPCTRVLYQLGYLGCLAQKKTNVWDRFRNDVAGMKPYSKELVELFIGLRNIRTNGPTV